MTRHHPSATPLAGLLILLICTAPARAQFDQADTEVLWAGFGDTPGDQYAWQCEAVGDQNGDGISEVVITAPFLGLGPGQAGIGRAHIHDGATGAVLDRLDGEFERGAFGFRTKKGRDIDADGVDDFIITAASGQGNTVPNQIGADFPGYVYLYSGADRTLIRRIDGPDEIGRLGMDADGVGDLDGDGWGDVLAGAPQSDHNGVNAGRAYIFSGQTGEILRTHEGAGEGARFGNGVARLDDTTGDGVFDYAIAAPGDGPNGQGMLYLFSGADGSLVWSVDPLDLPGGDTALDFGRFFVSQTPDANDDATPDVYVADWYDRVNGNISGRVWLLSGVDGTEISRVEAPGPNQWLGFGRGIPDVDGDGAGDLLICRNGFGQFRGAAGIWSGRTGEQIRFLSSSTPGELFGYDAAPLGDVDGDAILDFMVTAAGAGPLTGGDFGTAYVIKGVDHRPRPADVNLDGQLTPADFTQWLVYFNDPALPGAAAADINLDGTISPADFTAWLAGFNAGCA